MTKQTSTEIQGLAERVERLESRARRSRATWLGLGLLLGAAIPALIVASNVSVTHTFVNGTVANADEVNTNFADLTAATNVLSSATGKMRVEVGRIKVNSLTGAAPGPACVIQDQPGNWIASVTHLAGPNRCQLNLAANLWKAGTTPRCSLQSRGGANAAPSTYGGSAATQTIIVYDADSGGLIDRDVDIICVGESF